MSAQPGDSASELDGAGLRKSPRGSLFMHGLLYLPERAEPATVRIRNIAAGGVMADYPGSLPKDMPVQLELRNVGLITGRVAWSSPTQFGMKFDAEIDPAAVRRPVASGDTVPLAPTLRPFGTTGRRSLRS